MDTKDKTITFLLDELSLLLHGNFFDPVYKFHRLNKKYELFSNSQFSKSTILKKRNDFEVN